jgi:hypothetical protein
MYISTTSLYRHEAKAIRDVQTPSTHALSAFHTVDFGNPTSTNCTIHNFTAADLAVKSRGVCRINSPLLNYQLHYGTEREDHRRRVPKRQDQRAGSDRATAGVSLGPQDRRGLHRASDNRYYVYFLLIP